MYLVHSFQILLGQPPKRLSNFKSVQSTKSSAKDIFFISDVLRYNENSEILLIFYEIKYSRLETVGTFS